MLNLEWWTENALRTGCVMGIAFIVNAIQVTLGGILKYGFISYVCLRKDGTTKKHQPMFSEHRMDYLAICLVVLLALLFAPLVYLMVHAEAEYNATILRFVNMAYMLFIWSFLSAWIAYKVYLYGRKWLIQRYDSLTPNSGI
jgi:hypothetical protein